jgi:hypothetical protein
MRAFLAFHDSRQEAKWQLKFAQDQAGLDAAFSLQTLVFPSLVASAVSLQATQFLPLSIRRVGCKGRRLLRRQSHRRRRRQLPPPTASPCCLIASAARAAAKAGICAAGVLCHQAPC